MTLESLLLFALSICIITVKPGPGMVAIISRSLSDGFGPGLALAAGVHTVMQALFFVTILTYGAAQEAFGVLAVAMKILGSAYMMYLGAKGLMNLDRDLLGRSGARQVKAIRENYLAGLLTTLSNPFPIIFFASILPGLVDIGHFTLRDMVFGSVALLVCNGGILASEALLASHLRSLLGNKTVLRRINIGANLAFVGIGLFLAFSLLPLVRFNPMW